MEGEDIICNACSHRCKISEGGVGRCGVRKNNNGKLYSLVYNKIAAYGIDLIEKKPFYHLLPGTKTLSIGTIGCNFGCLFCQNADLSFPREKKIISGEEISPEQIVKDAKNNNCKSIAYTYNEPTIFIELMLDTSKLAKKEGIKNLMITNGYMTEEAFNLVSEYIDAMNIDLKSFSDKFYRETCKASLEPVLNTIRRAYNKGIHIEITTLLIPGENDDEEQLKNIAKFIADIDKNIPWHISRFFPMYKMQDKQPTDIASIKKAEEIGKNAGLKNIYLGNI